MNIVVDRPPNYDAIVEAFPRAADMGVIFAYGDTIYNPSGFDIAPPLIAHEKAHGRRQAGDPAAWWTDYIAFWDFRYFEELEAHAAELRAQYTVDRNAWARALHRTAHRLIADLYQYPKHPNGPDFKQALDDLREAL